MQMVDCQVASVSAITSHVDKTLPHPYIISSKFKRENECSGVFVMIVSSSSSKIIWRVVGSKAIVQVERGKIDGNRKPTLYPCNYDHCTRLFPCS
ncbi:hypothetical protein GQ457_13G017320 [Hibiscus cannabinus]